MSLKKRARQFYDLMKQRRTIRSFEPARNVPLDTLQACIQAAGTAPSGANCQPWFFALVVDPDIKRQIRVAAEKEEKAFYEHRAKKDFLEDLRPLGTGWQKPHLEEASALIAVFVKTEQDIEGRRTKSRYPTASVGIATGILITALHQLGFSLLPHTPAPMSFLTDILDRPDTERPFLILAVGEAKKGHEPPSLRKKSLDEICEVY